MNPDEQSFSTPKALRWFLCHVFGFHSWTWSLQNVGVIYLDGPPPDCAVCQHCGKRYKD